MWDFRTRLSEGEKNELVPSTYRLGKQTLRCQRCQSSRAEHWMNAPPIAPLPSCFSWCVPPLYPSLSLSLLLSPSVSWNITVGQKSPHWRLRGCIMRINELEVNMQVVCCLPLYTSQPIGFHQKLRWIVSQKKAQTMPRSVLFIQSRISKAISKDLTRTFIPIRNILFIRFLSPSLVFISSEGDGDDPVCEIAFVVSFHT